MDKLTKQQILSDINAMEVEDLHDFLMQGDISIEEMISAGLERSKLSSIRHGLIAPAPAPAPAPASVPPPLPDANEKIKKLCAEIEQNEHDVFSIKNFIINGELNEQDLKKYTGITVELLERVKSYQKQDTDFMSWSEVPPLQPNRSDVYFFGQPGSGKSCVLGSLFYFFENRGLLIENMNNQVGTRYRNQLSSEFSHGILPYSTAENEVNYMPLDLRNIDNNKIRHPLNFVEMSGELFDKAYNEGMENLHPKLKEYLSNRNRKILFFVIDYQMHKRAETINFGASQGNKLTAVLELLDQFGSLNYTDAIYVLVTKCDLFPSNAEPKQHAKEFMDSQYLNFINNLKDKKEKYKNKSNFMTRIFPYSIGKIKYKNLLESKDLASAESITKAIHKHAFAVKEGSFFSKIFG
jgi:hypothetical protein